MDMSRLLTQLVEWLMLFIGAILGLRFILRLFGADADNGFVEWVYGTSGEILSPFRSIFESAVLEGGFVIDFTALFGLVVYGLAGLLAVRLIAAWSR